MKQRSGLVRARHALASMCALCGASSAPAETIPLPNPPITWVSCPGDLVDADWAIALGSRLECGTMVRRLDDDAPAKGTITVGLIRLKAGIPAEREGSIFFNFGGPGGNPRDFLPPLGYLWSTRSLDHPLDGDKRRLTDRFDLVAVIPRGLRGGTVFDCGPVPEFLLTHDPTAYLADWNWKGFVEEARNYAMSCARSPLHAYMGTLHHVRDMEHARRGLGEPSMNFLGISYGTWVGAFYASMYPDRTGRFVLDSSMNFAGTIEEQVEVDIEETQARFARTVLRPALADPLAYGLGNDARTIMTRLRTMPPRARSAWVDDMRGPSQLAAALTLADWIREEGDPTRDRLIERIKGHAFSSDANSDTNVRNAATSLVKRLGTALDLTLGGLVDPSVNTAVVCGDTPWGKNHRDLRDLAFQIINKYPAASGHAVVYGLICANWATPAHWRPPLTELAKAPPLLMVQSEFDPATPYFAAMKAFNASPGAYMVLALGSDMHGLFGRIATPCVEHAVGRYLLTGELPATHFSTCEHVPLPPPRETRDAHDGPTESETRAELARRLRHS